MTYATFFQRVIAFIIDAILLVLVSLVIGFVLPGSSESLLGQLVSFLIGIAYFAGMESSARQATFGKSTLGLRVTDLAGNRLTPGRAIGRYLGKYVSALLLMIGFLLPLFTKKRQALHDKMAGTLVMGPKTTPGRDDKFSDHSWNDHRMMDSSSSD